MLWRLAFFQTITLRLLATKRLAVVAFFINIYPFCRIALAVGWQTPNRITMLSQPFSAVKSSEIEPRALLYFDICAFDFVYDYHRKQIVNCEFGRLRASCEILRRRPRDVQSLQDLKDFKDFQSVLGWSGEWRSSSLLVEKPFSNRHAFP